MKANSLQNLEPGHQIEINSLPPREKNRYSGIGCGTLLEPIPEYIKAPCEEVIEGGNNTSIVFGRDRSGPRFVTNEHDNGNNLGPYGPKGYMKCGSIDIVVGRFSANTPTSEEILNTRKSVKVNPDFFKDSARIYISQLTDIDTNFKIGLKENRKNEKKSAIGIKADNVRLISRESIKLVTGTDTKNSLGGNNLEKFGIDLIANNNEKELQSLLKGGNTVECLKRLVNHINKLNGIIDAFLKYQMSFNEAVTTHTHISPFYGLPTAPSEVVMVEGRRTSLQMLNDVQISLLNNRINMTNFEINYLNQSGRKYICSRFNRTN